MRGSSQRREVSQTQRNPIIHQIILTENKVLELSERKQQKVKEVNDLKDLIRMYKEREITIQPSYARSNGIYLKKSYNQLYPSLQKSLAMLNAQKNLLHKSLLQEMKIILKMIKAQLVGKTQLDSRVFSLLLQYQTSYEHQLISSSDEDQIS